MENLTRVIQDQRPAALNAACTFKRLIEEEEVFICEGRPDWKPQSIWEWGECTILRHNLAQSLSWISRWPPSVQQPTFHAWSRCHGDDTKSSIGGCCTKLFCSVSKLRARVDALQINKCKKKKKKPANAWSKIHLKSCGFLSDFTKLVCTSSYLMDDLRHRQLVHVWVHLLTRLSIRRAVTENRTISAIMKEWRSGYDKNITLRKRRWLLCAISPPPTQINRKSI